MLKMEYFQSFQYLYYIAGIVALILTLPFVLIYLKYRKSNYRMVSGNIFLKVLFDQGVYGEFLLFTLLEKLPGNNKLLTNIYVPKEDGKTTEVDVVMLNKTGIYVFENKNYGGWIFGDESSKFWTQLFKGGRKIKFLNPVWQNQGHIKALQKLLKEVSPGFYYSYIVFGQRCELKKVLKSENEVIIVKRKQLTAILKKNIESRPEVFEESQVERLYGSLQKFTLVSNDIKQEHILNIQNQSRNL